MNKVLIKVNCFISLELTSKPLSKVNVKKTVKMKDEIDVHQILGGNNTQQKSNAYPTT